MEAQQSFDALRVLDKKYSHLTVFHKTERELLLSDFLYSRGHFFDRSNFGPKRHGFFYTAKKVQPIIHQDESEKLLKRVNHLKSDVQDFVLLHLFSKANHQQPSTLFSHVVHDFTRSHRTPNGSSKPSTLTKVTDNVKQHTHKHGTRLSPDQMEALFLRTKIISSSKTTRKFSEQFPSTTVPTISLILGTPKIDRSCFNTVLISMIRSAKSVLKEHNTHVPTTLPKKVILRFSRYIDLTLKLELEARREKASHQRQQLPSKGKAKAKPKGTRTPGLGSELSKLRLSEGNSNDKDPLSLSPQRSLSPEPEITEVRPITPTPTPNLEPWREFTQPGQHIMHASDIEARKWLVAQRFLKDTYDSRSPTYWPNEHMKNYVSELSFKSFWDMTLRHPYTVLEAHRLWKQLLDDTSKTRFAIRPYGTTNIPSFFVAPNFDVINDELLESYRTRTFPDQLEDYETHLLLEDIIISTRSYD
jgi:hypothetical protein